MTVPVYEVNVPEYNVKTFKNLSEKTKWHTLEIPKVYEDNKPDFENIDNKKIDFFALEFKVKKDEEYFNHFLEPFYYWPIADIEKPIRIDLSIIYDVSELIRLEHRYKGRENELKRDGFVFEDHDKKTEALKAIITIL